MIAKIKYIPDLLWTVFMLTHLPEARDK